MFNKCVNFLFFRWNSVSNDETLPPSVDVCDRNSSTYSQNLVANAMGNSRNVMMVEPARGNLQVQFGSSIVTFDAAKFKNST